MFLPPSAPPADSQQPTSGRRPRPVDPFDPAQTTTSPGPLSSELGGDFAPSEAAAGSDSPTAEKSSPGSTSGPGLPVNARQAVQVAIGTVARAFSGVLSSRLSPEADPTAWHMADDEVDAVAVPLSRIVARRVSLPGGSKASDVADGVEAAVGLLAWLIGSVERTMIARAYEAQAPGGMHAGQDPAPADQPVELVPSPFSPA